MRDIARFVWRDKCIRGTGEMRIEFSIFEKLAIARVEADGSHANANLNAALTQFALCECLRVRRLRRIADKNKIEW